MKTLFCLVSDDGDGSYSIHFTFNKKFIDDRNARQHEFEHGDLGFDGDGFHYKTLTVPDECTLESLGIHYDAAVDYDEDVEEQTLENNGQFDDLDEQS